VAKNDRLDVIYEQSIHAEVDAILKLPPHTNMRKVTLYVVREGMRLSRPCHKCEQVIRNLGIRKVFYSDNGIMVRMTE
jgi:deoxycytidylate deaminase